MNVPLRSVVHFNFLVLQNREIRTTPLCDIRPLQVDVKKPRLIDPYRTRGVPLRRSVQLGFLTGNSDILQVTAIRTVDRITESGVGGT